MEMSKKSKVQFLEGTLHPIMDDKHYLQSDTKNIDPIQIWWCLVDMDIIFLRDFKLSWMRNICTSGVKFGTDFVHGEAH